MITAVIPAYNESDRIVNTLKKIQPFVDEILVVDDASNDRTAEISKKSGVRVISHIENKGYIEAIKYGFREAKGDIVVTLDADG